MISIDKDLIKELLAKGRRVDHRKFDEYREAKIETGIIPSAEGSARVRLGDTEVIAGVKMGIGDPFPDTPNDGVLMVNAEFLQLAYSGFESGPPGEDSIELARVVDRAIRESKTLDTAGLCIEPGKKVWMVFIDIDIIDHDGNLIDAAGLASVAALLNTKMPKLVVEEEGSSKKYKVESETKTKPLPMKHKPVSVTFGKIGDKIIVDPNLQEETALDARLTMGVIDGALSSMQKAGAGGFTTDELYEMADKALEEGARLRALL